MLYGNKSIKKEIIEKAHNIAKQRGYILIFAANVGSISRGLQTLDSDCDVRFLYLKSLKNNKVMYPDKCKEEEIVYRYKEDSDEFVFDTVAFWDMTAFLQLLINPSINGVFSKNYGLYYFVEQTLLSPYTWDPYGIQQKLYNLIEMVYSKEWGLKYNLGLINKTYIEGEIVLKDYIHCAMMAMSMKYINKFNRPAPIHISTLLSIEDDSRIVDIVRNLLNELENKTKEFYEINQFKRHRTKKQLYANRNYELDRYICHQISVVKSQVAGEQFETDIIYKEEIIKKMYDIIERALNEPIIIGVSDGEKY
ncbi:MAG: nucleotidyltransferase domain-containing protein [Lachnospiraceae bacterium]|nr:nucleotidyltransferase domain-containing protein [Lachnospiraceae bacterium]